MAAVIPFWFDLGTVHFQLSYLVDKRQAILDLTSAEMD